MIRIYCDAADAVLRETQTLTAGMINYPEVLLTFSDDWDGYGKAVIVRAGEVEKAALIVNNKFIVPSECLAESGVSLIVGISGSDGVHTIPTIWCSCGEIMDGTDVQDSTAIGDATPSLVDQMLGYAQDVVEEAQTLQNYIIKTVVADDSNADNFGEASVNVVDSGEGANRTLTFYFSNIKGRSVVKLLFTNSGENRGRLQVQLEGAEPVNFDGVKDALDAVADALYEADITENTRAEAEAARVDAEDQRDLAEQDRVTAETARDNAESNRAEAERTRDANEGTRIANEEARETNENTRQSNEQSRSNAETARANAETARATEFAEWQEEESTFGLKSEGYAVGEQDGVPVGSGSEYYHNNAKYYAENAETAASNAATHETAARAASSSASRSEMQAQTDASNAANKAYESEGYAVGQQGGTDVGSDSVYYHNNAKYFSEQAATSATAAQTAQTGAEAAQQEAQQAAQDMSDSVAQITTNKNDISDLENAITNVIQFTPLLFTVGGIKGASGEDNAVTDRLRTLTYMPNDIIDVTAENGYSFSIFAWNASGTYQGKIVTNGTISTSGSVKWHTICDFYKLAKDNPTFKWKIVVRNDAGTDIDITEAVNIKVRTYNKSIQNLPVMEVPNNCNDLYALYDAFVSSGFATKETLATINTLPLNLYKFSIQNTFATGADNSPDPQYKNLQKKSVLLTSGMHGDEKGAVIGLYNLLRNMCNKCESEKYLSEYDFYVIPIANPTGYNSNTRENYQVININRLDEAAETAEVIAIKQVTDARYYDLYIDFHNCPGSRSSETIDEAIGAMSFATDTEREEKQKQYNTYKKAFSGFYRDINEIFSKDISFNDQLLFPWLGTTYTTWRNYVYKKQTSLNLGTITNRKFIRATNGNILISTTEPYLSCTDFVDVSGYRKITYRQINSTSATEVKNGIAFYDENQTYISGIQSEYGASQAHYSDKTVTIPLNAKYARFSMYEDSTTYGDFYCHAFVGSEISACNETSNYCYKISGSTVKENNSSAVCSIAHIQNTVSSFLDSLDI